MITSSRKISAAAIAKEWPSAIISCVWDKAAKVTKITFEPTSPVPEKTLAEIEAAQDKYDVFAPWNDEMLETDRHVSRFDEDLVDLLISKGVIALAELPQDARDKITAKKTVREGQP